MKTNKDKLILYVLASLVLALLLNGCSSNDGTVTGSTQLTVSASNAVHTISLNPLQRMWRSFLPSSAHAVTELTDSAGNSVELTAFQISIREVKLKQEDDDAADVDEDSVDFEGPFAVDLINDAGDPVAQTIGDEAIPVGNYDGIRFVMHKDPDTAFPLTDRSIYIAGTVDFGAGSGAESFVMWHDTGENFDFFGSNPIVVDDSGINNLIVDFKLVSIIGAVDFSSADLNEDISPDAASAENQSIADALKEAIDAAADFGEDEDGDDVLDEDEDVD